MNASKLIGYLAEMDLDFSVIYKEYLEEVRNPGVEDAIANKLDCLSVVNRFISSHVSQAKKEHVEISKLISEAKDFHINKVQAVIDATISHEQRLIDILEGEDWSWLEDLGVELMPRFCFYDDFDGTKKYAMKVYEMNEYDKKAFYSLRDYLVGAKSSIESLYNGDSSKGKVVKKGYYNEFLEIYDDLSKSYELCISLTLSLESKMDNLLLQKSNYVDKMRSLSTNFIDDLKKFRPSKHDWIDFAVSESLALVEQRHNKQFKRDSQRLAF
ncbi:hypothetical protein ACN1YD_003411 [Vibrio cholerae]|nr:hypothetical protein [Vibrio vulnificus]ELV8706777.1 hypothetical protein [Vibrio vulnificus]ELV8809171.1 hypothetical protein [Vibrio vulnificus]MCU8404452.1 hypothetical protein [Vibrio vulnificus]MCU8527689.1 hypothetical protein [Vibrio vulnificus]